MQTIKRRFLKCHWMKLTKFGNAHDINISNPARNGLLPHSKSLKRRERPKKQRKK
jgi:hypothetical protein